jgi:uncharacterized protein DUF3768
LTVLIRKKDIRKNICFTKIFHSVRRATPHDQAHRCATLRPVISCKINGRAVFSAKRFDCGALFGEAAMDIREANDLFRTTFRDGEVVFTASVSELPDMVKTSVLLLVADFKDFNEENDPLEEHGYGSFNHCNREFFFKIERIDGTQVMTVGLTMDW